MSAADWLESFGMVGAGFGLALLIAVMNGWFDL